MKIVNTHGLIFAICFLLLLFCIPYCQAQTYTILRPNGDVLTEWDGSPTPHWSRIDEDESSPDTVFVIWVDGDENQSEIFEMTESALEDRVVEKIEVHIYGFRYWTGPALVSINLGYWTEAREVPITTYAVGVDEWISCSWDNLQATYNDLVNLEVNVTAGEWCSGPPRNGYCRIDVLYCKIFYGTRGIPGYNIVFLMGISGLASLLLIKRKIKSSNI